MAQDFFISLPKHWSRHIKSAVLHAISLASMAFTAARGKASREKALVIRLRAELQVARSEIALLKEEISIKNERLKRIPPHNRPFYNPPERMRILNLKAARGWSTPQAADAFLLNDQTVSSWLRRIDEQGENALIRLQKPVNKFPDFVHFIVRQLKLFFPDMGRDRIACILARAGLHLGATTVARMLKKDKPPAKDAMKLEVPAPSRVVTAKYPNHVYHVDLTVVPTKAGFWVPWFPFCFLQVWPFCWWVAVVVDHYSRLVVGFAVFPKDPTSIEIRNFLGRVFHNAGQAPKYIISDKHRIFFNDDYKRWCRRKKISPRYGAVGKHGSIAIVERFIRSLKTECTRRLFVPIRLQEMRDELSFYTTWFNDYRPHSALDGKTPREVYQRLQPANGRPRFEPRPNWPTQSPCASPQTSVKGKPGTKLSLQIGHLEGRTHLPVVRLREAA
jgi:transposase InsO family protein